MILNDLLASVIPAIKVAELLEPAVSNALGEIESLATDARMYVEMNDSEVEKSRWLLDKIKQAEGGDLNKLLLENSFDNLTMATATLETRIADSVRQRPGLEIKMLETKTHWEACKGFKVSGRQIRAVRRGLPSKFNVIFPSRDINVQVNEVKEKAESDKALEQAMRRVADKRLWQSVAKLRSAYKEIDECNEQSKTLRGEALAIAIKRREELVTLTKGLNNEHWEAKAEAERLGIKYFDPKDFKEAREKFLKKFKPKRAAKENRQIVEAPTVDQMIQGLAVA